MAGTMSILESDRAIIQAEEVTTLTRLAFFFIQLTYASGIFGMNIKELADADMSTWIITSACLLLACYSILRPIALIYTLFAGLYDATLPIWIIPLIIYILRVGLKTSSMKVDDTLRHCESTFSAFIRTMSINETGYIFHPPHIYRRHIWYEPRGTSQLEVMGLSCHFNLTPNDQLLRRLPPGSHVSR
ncbi:hypothetical protein IWX50DRAFT_407774 [Phyllosticta citricarpa]